MIDHAAGRMEILPGGGGDGGQRRLLPAGDRRGYAARGGPQHTVRQEYPGQSGHLLRRSDHPPEDQYKLLNAQEISRIRATGR